MVPGYTHFGGRHAETAAVRNVLMSYGVTAPHTGEPYSEALLLGLGGGLSAGYFAFQYGELSTLYVGTRGLWYKWDASFIERIATRVGGAVESKESTSAKAAQAALAKALDAGQPACVWTDLGGLPQSGFAGFQYSPQTVVVCGYDAVADSYAIDDIAPRPWHMSSAQLADARAMIKSLKNRWAVISPPRKPAALAANIIAGIKDCVADLNNPRMKNFGITAIEKWAELVANPKDPKGWPRAFPPGPNLFRALVMTYRWIGGKQTGGGFRGMYGEFLTEAAGITGNQRLADVAAKYAALGAMWTRLAETALPESVPEFRRMRAVLAKRSRLIESKAAKDPAELAGLTSDVHSGMMCNAGEFPLSEEESLALLGNMRDRLVELHAAEVDAMEALRRAVK